MVNTVLLRLTSLAPRSQHYRLHAQGMVHDPPSPNKHSNNLHEGAALSTLTRNKGKGSKQDRASEALPDF